MNPSMDDRHILAEIERRLARDDPELASRIDTLNRQFPQDSEGDHNDTGKRRDWRVVTAVVLTIVALLGLLLTAILGAPPRDDDNQNPPGRLPPSVSEHTQHRLRRSQKPPPRHRRGAGAAPLAHPRHRRRGNVMRARDLAEPYLSIRNDADALEAVRVLVEQRLPGLLVVDPTGQPYAILPACDVVRTLVPRYVQEDRLLAEVIDEPHADRLCRALQGRKVADCLPVKGPYLPTAGPDWTAIELAELMARGRSPLVAIVDRPEGASGRLLGVVTATRLLERLLQAA
ncbi:CBS domain-containing protein [Streptomyces jeddahensis]|uniref:CBS domain protein n=1 Tax=Streptomyces jeddahensis TaxID=1716141 RepID=A0A177HFY5_9ACTN|nr:CBS domain-containing protein [Streptomyces jeddahensis]OAH09872.1 CBS domain protein [Streptomyces jeddahensis]